MPFTGIGKGIGGKLDTLSMVRKDGTYTASNREHVISDGGTITLPSPVQDGIVMVSKFDELNPTVDAGTSSIDGNSEVNVYESVPTIFLSDGSAWYTTDLTLINNN